jgi:ribose transport system ATP-binding protein
MQVQPIGTIEASTATAPPLLEMRGISKTFPGVRALDRVQLEARSGEVLALMGENGAGKSTLMKILSGAYHADPGGEIRISGRPVAIGSPQAARDLGIAVIYQELSLAPNLSVAENIHLGDEPSRFGWVDRRAMQRRAQAVLDRLGVGFRADIPVGSLSIAEQQLVEIARALHAESNILVMDEPTTALSSRETDRLFALIRQLRAEGLAIIYISHRMAEIYELSDRVSVLRDGGYVGTLNRDEITPDRLVAMMVGRTLDAYYTHEHAVEGRVGRTLLKVRDVADHAGRVRGCSFDLRAGEVLGLAGLVGSGRTELARLIYGADRRRSGTIELDGRAIDPRTPGDGLNAGIAYLTEDRKHLGLFLDMSVRDNVTVGVIARDARPGGLLNRPRGEARARGAIEAMAIRVPGPASLVGGLSGGNQQKVLLSRWLEIDPIVLILDEPTRGVDVGAKQEIYRTIDRLARDGMAILVISSELPELIGIADRILVMREGHIAGEVGGPGGPAVTQENIMALATGADGGAAAYSGDGAAARPDGGPAGDGA